MYEWGCTPALCGDVRALRVGQQVDGQLHGPNGRAKGNDRLRAPDRSGRSDLRRPCPAAALGIGEQPSMSPQPSIKFRPTIRLGCATVNENDLSTYNCGFYAQCTRRFTGSAGGAGQTSSSRPAGIAEPARRVRLPDIEALCAATELLPPTGCGHFRIALHSRRPASPRRAGCPPCHAITGKISDVVVPRSELSCCTLPPICRASAAISFNPDPCGFACAIPRPLSDTVKRPSP